MLKVEGILVVVVFFAICNLRELSLACNKTFLKTVVDNCLLYRALHHASPSNLSSKSTTQTDRTDQMNQMKSFHHHIKYRVYFTQQLSDLI